MAATVSYQAVVFVKLKQLKTLRKLLFTWALTRKDPSKQSIWVALRALIPPCITILKRSNATTAMLIDPAALSAHRPEFAQNAEITSS